MDCDFATPFVVGCVVGPDATVGAWMSSILISQPIDVVQQCITLTILRPSLNEGRQNMTTAGILSLLARLCSGPTIHPNKSSQAREDNIINQQTALGYPPTYHADDIVLTSYSVNPS